MKAIDSSRKRTGIRASAQIYLFKNNFLPYATERLKEIKKQLHISGKNVNKGITYCNIDFDLTEPPASPRDRRPRPRIYVKTD